MESLSTSLQPFFDWLSRSTIRAGMVICLILLIQRVLRGRLTVRWHYVLWLILVVRMVLPFAPQSRFSIFNLITWQNQSHAPGDVASSKAGAESSAPQQTSSQQEKGLQSSETVLAVVSDATSKEQDAGLSVLPGTSDEQTSPTTEFVLGFVNALPVLWLAGAVLLGGYIVICNLKLWRAASVESPSTDKEVLDLLEECRSEIGLRTIVALVPSEKVNTPILLGFIRPRLLVPKSIAEGLDREELRYVFLHELAHVKRYDIALGWLTALLQVLHWFNPLVWLAFHRMRSDRELACDAFVLSRTQGEGTKDYGRAIVSMVERFSTPQSLPGLAGILENRSQLKRRIAMIAQFDNKSYSWSPLAVVLIVAISCVSLPDAIGSKKPRASWPESEPSISLRRIKTGSMSDFSSVPSLDGRYLCDMQYRPTRLVIRDLVTGEIRTLTEPTEGYFWCQAISPDSEYVAYVHQSWSPSVKELQLINMDGTGHRVVYRFEEDEMLHIRAWTPDGKKIVGAFEKKGEPLRLAAFSVEDGSMQVLHTFDTYWPMWQSPLHKVAISPDGRYIAYDRPPKKGSWNSDIYVLDIENQRAECVLQHPAYDKLLDWTPDGRHLFFKSDRRQGVPGGFTATDTWDAYLLPVANGKPQGYPVIVKRDIPEKLRPKGFTRDGTYYYAVEFRTIEVAVVKLDLQAGKLLGSPQLAGQAGADQVPAWSPDGKHLAYCTHELNNSQTIRIQNVATGQERKLDPNLPHFTWLRWSPDGKSFLVSNFAKNSPRAIYRINAETGERLTMVQSESPKTLPGEPQLSPDGGTLFYVLHHSDSKKASLLARDIESGHEEELFALEGTQDIGSLTVSLSPDSRQLALATQVKASSGEGVDRRISVIPAKGGKPRELCMLGGLRTRQTITWTPDGQALLFTKRVPEGGRELWFVPIGGGSARRLCRARELMCQGMLYGAASMLDMHPDGKRLAFDCFEYRHEVWAMENFLPKAATLVSRDAAIGPATQPKFTKIRIPSRPGNGVLSPDGKILAFISQGTVWVIPVSGEVDPYIAGEPKRLTADIGAWNMNSTLSWSGDGKWIAFNAEYKVRGFTKVYVISSTGGDAIAVPIPFRRCGWPEEFRLSLSPDGKTLAYASLISADEGESDKPTVFTIPVNGGEAKQLTDAWTQEPAFSPEGDKVAYVKNYRGDNGKRHSDVWVIPAAGGTPVQVSNLHSGQVRGPLWSPDGKMIAFHRRPEGKNPKEIWIIPVSENGKPTASPAKIELPLETFHAVAGWTPDNKIGLHLMNPSHETIYSVPSTGGIATQITPEGMAAYPKWSPDGSRIFFRWYEGEIASAPAGGGEVTTIPINSEFGIYEAVPGGGNDISPDGETIVFSGAKHFYEDDKKRSEVDIFTIPIEGGEPIQLTSSGSAQDRFPCWSPDGKSIAFIRLIAKNNKPVVHIHIVSQEGRNLRLITTPSDNVAWAPIDWSPDGKSITYFSSDNMIKSIPVEGGESQALARIDAINSHFDLAWSPNGKKLAYTCKGKIWVISRDGGTPEEVETGLDVGARATKIGWSPDGKRVAFTVHGGGSHELHLMENFLPKAVASASN
ncbi:M56 family metallopeptidase [Planctomycetota bacterium]